MKRFSGMYYKHQKGGNTVSFIAGTTAEHAFIQVITNKKSYYFKYPLPAAKQENGYRIGGNIFSERGVILDIRKGDILISGRIRYSALIPIKYGIMGPFKYLPMQCRHKISSLYHRLDGKLNICGEELDLTGGVGYIEGDSGRSFPKSYAWIQCSDFPEKACVTLSVADVPFMGMNFPGCICVVYFRGAEYRLATYLGVKIIRCDEKRIVIEQGKLRLEIELNAGVGHKLRAPENGKMVREIRECIVCGARFKFIKSGNVLFDWYSENASFECMKSPRKQ